MSSRAAYAAADRQMQDASRLTVLAAVSLATGHGITTGGTVGVTAWWISGRVSLSPTTVRKRLRELLDDRRVVARPNPLRRSTLIYAATASDPQDPR